MSSFDNRKQIKFSADAPSFSAVITPGTAVQTAVLTWKKGWKVGAPSITTSTMDQLMAELSRLDAGVKFYKRGANEGTLSAKDAAMLASFGTIKTQVMPFTVQRAPVSIRSRNRAVSPLPRSRARRTCRKVCQPCVPVPRLGWLLRPLTVSYFNHHTAS